jgi:hypothetical protein
LLSEHRTTRPSDLIIRSIAGGHQGEDHSCYDCNSNSDQHDGRISTKHSWHDIHLILGF